MNSIKKIRHIFIWAVLGGIIFSVSYAYSQQIISERPIVYDNGVMKSDAVTVNFKEKVLDLPTGQRIAIISDINPDFQEVIQYLKDLSNRYGEITFRKQIPSAKWGDVWRRNRRTGELVKLHDMSQLFSVRFTQFVPIDEIIAELEQLAAVEYAHQPVQVMTLSDPPNDSLYNATDQWNLYKIEAEKAWDITHGSSNVKVGIVDPGCFHPSHLDLRNKFVPSRGDTVGTGGLSEYHGTEVAGVVGAETDNQIGIASLGWNIMMIPYAWSQWDTVELVTLIEDSAMTYPVDIINCSFITIKSGVEGSWNYPSVRDAIDNAITQGIVVVAGTGNYDANGQDPPFVPYPANNTGVIGVAATDSNDAHPTGYNYQEDRNFIDVAAPGWYINTPYMPPNNYHPMNGTSLAAPHVSALAGLILSVNSNLTPYQIERIIEETAEDLGNWSYFGHGRINAYQALLRALAYDNKTPNISPTVYNNQRILARGKNDTAHLYEVFYSGTNYNWEVFFRKSTDNGSSWGTPVRLSAGDLNNRLPCLSVTDAGNDDGIHVVWQRKKDNGKYQVYYRKSSNTGSSWQNAVLLADDVTCSSSQSAGPMPVITSISYASTYKLIVVWVCNEGLKYRAYYNGAWGTAATIANESNPTYVWFPSVMGKGIWASMTYDNKYYQGVYSRTFNGTSWSDRARVDKDDTNYDRKSQIAITLDDKTVAVWYARPVPSGNYRICYREGTSNNTWIDQYTEFAHDNRNAYLPAVTYHPGPEEDRAVVYYTDDNQVHLQIRESTENNWTGFAPGTDNRYPNITHLHSGTPKMIWTADQSSSTGPYAIELSQQYLSKTAVTNPIVYHRRAVYDNEMDRTALCLEWGEVEALTMTGQTIPLDFVLCDQGKNLGLNAANLMDYLTTAPITLPADAERIQFNLIVYTNCQQDTTKDEIRTEFKSFDVTFRITDRTKGQSYTITEIFSDPDGAINFSQDMAVDVKNLAGSSVVLKPEISGAKLEGGNFSYALGHIYIEREKELEKPFASELKTLHPEKFAILQNYPNPFNPDTEIRYQLPEAVHVTLAIYNLLGQRIRTLVDEVQQAGYHTVRWDGKDETGIDVASGVYLYVLNAGEFNDVKKMLLLR